MTIRLAIAQDQRMVRELLSALLAREPDIEVVGEAGLGKDAIDLAARLVPDVLILDIDHPGLAGAGLARALKKMLPGVKLLALSPRADKYSVEQMLKAGADGYVAKSSGVSELVRAIRIVVEGKVYLSPDVTRTALSGHLSAGAETLLSSREREVVALIADGRRSAEIAAQLSISTATVESHRARIMRKLGLRSIAGLTKYAIRHGLTPP